MLSKENIWCACVGGAGREKWLRNKQQMCAGKPSRTPCKSVYARKWTSQSCLRATHTHFHSLIGNEVKHKWKKPNALKCNLTTPPPKQTQSSRSLWLPAVKWNRYQCWCARASKHSTHTCTFEYAKARELIVRSACMRANSLRWTKEKSRLSKTYIVIFL